MRLLILLSAMLAGLTGIIAGQPAFAHRGEQALVAASAVAPVERARTASVGRVPAFALSDTAPVVRELWRVHPSIAPRGERRLE